MSSIRVSGNAKRDYAAERFQLQIQVQASGTTSGKAVKAGNQAVEAFLRTMQEALAIEPKDWTAGEYSVERSYAAEHEFNFSRSLNLWVEADQNLVQAMTARMEEMENVAFHISFGLDREAEKEQETGEVTDDGHIWSEWTVTAAATCTEDGSRERACTDCDAVETETIPAGHSWSEWTVTSEATCTEDGSRERTCSACDETEVEVIPAAGHAWDTDDEEAAATCTVCGETREAVNAFNIELDGDFWRQGGDGDVAEYPEYWDALFGGVLYTENWAEDLLTVLDGRFLTVA